MNTQELLRARLIDPVVQQMTQGLSAEKIALTVGVGLAIAVIPVIGVTTAMSFLAAWALKLNQPIIQTINWTSAPLQLLLIIPFIRVGERLFHAPRMRMSLEDIVATARANPTAAFAELGMTVGHAVVAWLLAVPVIVAATYWATLPLFRAISRRVAERRLADPDVHDVA